MARLLSRARLVLIVALIAIALVGACGTGNGPHASVSTDATGPGPTGDVAVSGLTISAPAQVASGQRFQIDIHAPAHSKTAYVYWQERDGDAAWKTFALTTGGPQTSEDVVFIDYPVPSPFPVESSTVFPETVADPTSQMTLAPKDPGRYRILKSLIPPGTDQPVWVATEITVTA